MSLMNEQDWEDFKEFLVRNQPHVVVVGAVDLTAQRLFKDIAEFLHNEQDDEVGCVHSFCHTWLPLLALLPPPITTTTTNNHHHHRLYCRSIATLSVFHPTHFPASHPH
jgi:hypothetical protein